LVDNRIISGQIDRLVVLPHKVMIVDYKTNRPAAKNLKDVPISYIKQMRSYKQLIKRIYPSKQIECYILWTNTAHMMKIE
jgi:ATP-dependent helicase/nuclease subunit A